MNDKDEIRKEKVEDKCWVKTELKGCCCQCKWHIADYSHPYTDGKGASRQRGWVCIGFLMTGNERVVYSEWHKHGMCEMFEKLLNE